MLPFGKVRQKVENMQVNCEFGDCFPYMMVIDSFPLLLRSRDYYKLVKKRKIKIKHYDIEKIKKSLLNYFLLKNVLPSTVEKKNIK